MNGEQTRFFVFKKFENKKKNGQQNLLLPLLFIDDKHERARTKRRGHLATEQRLDDEVRKRTRSPRKLKS